MVTLTENAAERLQELLRGQESGENALRIYVKPGGCSGFSYGMALDNAQDGDRVYEIKGVKVAVAPDSSDLVEGAEVDFIDDLTGQGFRILNPNATMTCGCGSSFRTADDPGQPGSCD